MNQYLHNWPTLTARFEKKRNSPFRKAQIIKTAEQGIDPSVMQHKETVQEYECERNEVSHLLNVCAEGGTTPRSPYIEIMNQKTTRHQQTKAQASTYALRTKEEIH